VSPWEQWRIQVSDQNSKRFRFDGHLNCKGHNPFLPLWITMLILKGLWRPIFFIVVQAISLKIGTLDISGLLFLNLHSELSYEVWIKSYKHLKTGFLSGRVHICHNLTTRCEVPSWSRSKYSPDLWHLRNIHGVQAKWHKWQIMVLEGTENANSSKSNPQTPLFRGVNDGVDGFSEWWNFPHSKIYALAMPDININISTQWLYCLLSWWKEAIFSQK